LLEAMLAVAIFSIGILTLGRCVSSCLAAEHFKVEDARARRVLENRLAEIEAGAVPITKTLTEDLKEPFAGFKITQTPTLLKKQNEKKEELTGIYSVNIQVEWGAAREKNSKSLVVYVQPRQP
jgi:hypothetical protein